MNYDSPPNAGPRQDWRAGVTPCGQLSIEFVIGVGAGEDFPCQGLRPPIRLGLDRIGELDCPWA
ncbi:unnamed protein product [Prunus armeniaca]